MLVFKCDSISVQGLIKHKTLMNNEKNGINGIKIFSESCELLKAVSEASAIWKSYGRTVVFLLQHFQ